jgi:hypothetical protein
MRVGSSGAEASPNSEQQGGAAEAAGLVDDRDQRIGRIAHEPRLRGNGEALNANLADPGSIPGASTVSLK